MTTRLKGVTVAFEKDIRVDDAEALIAAIEQLRGVLKVLPIESDFGSQIEVERARRELGEKLWHVLYPKKDSDR